MTTEPFTPHADSFQTAWVLMCQQSRVPTQPPVEELEAEFDRFLARVRRDAAREALNGLYEDASQEYRIGLQGDDQEHMDAAEAVLRATYAWMDNYPEETP